MTDLNVLYKDLNNVTVTHSSTDNPGHDYEIAYPDKQGLDVVVGVSFQNGPVKEHGVNGITSEALLAILIHRTETLNGSFPCAENEAAIEGLKMALFQFEQRTKNRVARNVEGQNKA